MNGSNAFVEGSVENTLSKKISVQEWINNHSTPSQAEQSVDISIVIPAFNEQWRLPTTLIDIIDYFDKQDKTWEVVVVDDGSSDDTCEVVRKFSHINPRIRLISYKPNRGKGCAVRTGVLNASGRRIVFADADGATPIKELERLMGALDNGADIAIGSRAMKSNDTRIKTHWYRRYPGRLFNFCVNTFLLPNIADTQCGFKIFTQESANFIFKHQKADGFSMDIELLFIAKKGGFKFVEVPINWTHVPGSKVNMLTDSLRMLKDIFVFRIRHRNIRSVTEAIQENTD